MSNVLKYFIKNLVILIVALTLSFYFSALAGDLYQGVSGDPGTWIKLKALMGLPLAYIFFLFVFFTAFGGSKKYWWIGILLIPAAIFEIYFDLSHIYFPVALGLAGWLLGLIMSRFISKFLPYRKRWQNQHDASNPAAL